MNKGRHTSALRGLRTLFAGGSPAGLADGDLLRRYADRLADAAGAGLDAEAAFGALVDRHGLMVWGVCRRTLGDDHAAEDAFQATFLVLARRAGAVRVDGSLGRWLHGVARRVSARARLDGRKRRDRERGAATGEPALPAPDPERGELLAAVLEELGRLPEKYREPVALCHLEGLTYAGAAERLGCPLDTVKARLARGRGILRSRLTRRGLCPPDSSLGSLLALGPRAVLPPRLAALTARAAVAGARGATAAGASKSAHVLAQGVIRAMIMIRLSKILAVLAPASAGLWFLAGGSRSPEAAAPPVAPARAPAAIPDDPVAPPGAIAVPMPGRDDLHKILRRAAEAAITLAKDSPQPSSWTLSAIAKAQAMADDPAGARETFDAAVREAGGELGGAPDPWSLRRVGHLQAQAGFREEARRTLLRALEAAPGFRRDFDKDHWTLRTLAQIVEDLAAIGPPEQAKRAADRLATFAGELFKKSEIRNSEDVSAPALAAALASIGDFEGAFRRAGAVEHTDMVVGEAALAATRHLDRASARRFVVEAARRMDGIELTHQKYMGLGDLAEAWARLGDFEAARRSARSIGEGPTGVDYDMTDYDMTDGQPYALQRVASVQRELGDIVGARETLREGYRIILGHPKMRGPEGRYLQIALGQLGAGDVEGARTTVGSMAEGRRSVVLASVARSLAIMGKDAEAREAIARALDDAGASRKAPPKSEVEAIESPRVRVFSPSEVSEMQLAEIQAMAGDTAGALKTLRGIADELQQRFTLERVVTARAAAGDVAGAVRLTIEAARSPDERRSALHGVGRGVETRLQLEPAGRRPE